MKNKTIDSFSIVKVLIGVVILGLVAAVGYVAYTNFFQERQASVLDMTKPMPFLVRGANTIPESAKGNDVAVSESMTKYTQVPGLVEALGAYGDNNPCVATEGRFKQFVLGVTADQSQALIGNGCGSTGMLRSFMIKQDGEWVRIGSWNQKFGGSDNFSELLDTPSCQVVDQYQIQKSIAPVCFEELEGESDLFSGDVSNYTYRLRQ